MPISAKRIAKYISDLEGRKHGAMMSLVECEEIDREADFDDAADAHERSFMQYVYVVEAVGTGLVKIGVSDNPEKRLHSLQTSNPTDLRLLGYCMGSYAIEQALHLVLDEYRVRGEWFRNEGKCAQAVKAVSRGDFEAVGELLN